MDDIKFGVVQVPLPVSQNRVVALWYADVDKMILDDAMPPFTGAAALYALFDISGTMSYFVSLYDMQSKLFHTWMCEPNEIPLDQAMQFEAKIIESFSHQDIHFTPVLQATPTYMTILKKLPLTRVLDDKTPCVGDFKLSDFNSMGTGLKLSPADRNTFKALVARF